MKITQYLYVWINDGKKNIDCYNCHKDLSNNKKIPPMIVSRKSHPYCYPCAWKLNIIQEIGVVKHA